jgi:hypothetical protein
MPHLSYARFFPILRPELPVDDAVIKMLDTKEIRINVISRENVNYALGRPPCWYWAWG